MNKFTIDYSHHESVTEPSTPSITPRCPVCKRMMQLVPAGGWWVWSCPIHGSESYIVTNTTTPESARITYMRDKSDILQTGQFSILEGNNGDNNG